MIESITAMHEVVFKPRIAVDMDGVTCNMLPYLLKLVNKYLPGENIQMEDGEKEAIEAAIKDLEDVIKTDDKAAIESKTEALSQASAKMAERMYAAAQEQAQAAEGAADAGEQQASGDDNVVDAEFEEVDDKKK